MKKILVIAATELELQNIRKYCFQNIHLDYFISGVGNNFESDLKNKLNSKIYDVIINIGLAGGLIENSEIGNIIQATKVYSAKLNNTNTIDLKSHLNLNLNVDFRAPIVTVQEAVDSSARKQIINDNFADAVAVDMELYLIARVAEEYKIPVIALKVISDECQNINPQKIKNMATQLMQPINKIVKKIVNNI